MTKPFTTPFAADAPDNLSIPETAQPDGSVSYETGFGPDYSKDPLENGAKPVPRKGHNELFFQITGSIGDIQRQGAADWYPEFAADGGYPKNAIVWLDGDRWKSQIDGNTTRPNIDEIAWLPSAKFEGGGGGGGGDFGLTGPTTIAVGGSFQYKISPYSSFMTYAVSATNGTATISGDTITLTIAPEETANVTDLTVVRSDGARNDFRIAIGAQSIAKPSILSPASGSVDVPLGPLLTASAFMTYPVGADTHLNTDWRIRTMAGAVVWQSLANPTNKTNIQVPDNTLPLNTQLQADVRYRGTTLPVSVWSEAVTFTTTNQSISTPTITAPLNGATGIGATPTFTSTAFATNPLGADTHASSDWQLKNSLGAVIWSSIADVVNKTSITLPTGVLAVSSQYTMEVRYNGNVLQPSQWSPVVSFTTAASFAYGKYLFAARSVIPGVVAYGQDIDTFNRLASPPNVADARGMAVSPDGQYIMSGCSVRPYVRFYKRNGDDVQLLAAPATLPTAGARDCAISPDGVFYVIATLNACLVYKRSGDVFTLDSTLYTTITACLSFSGDGLYLAIGANYSTRIYKLVSGSYQFLTTVPGTSSLPSSVCFSNDGVYVVTTQTTATPRVVVCKRTGDSFTKISDLVSSGDAANSASFTKDGGYLVIGNSSTTGLLLFKRSGDTFNPLTGPTSQVSDALSVLFDSTGGYLAVGLTSGAAPTIYKFQSEILTKLAALPSPPSGATYSLAFYPSNKGA